MTEVLDVSYDGKTGEMTQFLILNEDGQPETRRATSENILLFDPEEKLPFDGGLHNFLSGDKALKVSEDPRVVVAQSGSEYSYILSVSGEVIETTPNNAEQILDAVYVALAEEDIDPLIETHRDILSEQVRRHVINPLYKTFNQHDRIEITASGWLIDDFYLVDWDAKMYAANDNRDGGDYIRERGSVVEKDKSYEFVRLSYSAVDFDDETVIIDGDEKELTEREMLFLSKVKWLLNRRHYHPDKPFWDYCDQWASVDATKPNLDKFSL